jgi:hypothetical protein
MKRKAEMQSLPAESRVKATTKGRNEMNGQLGVVRKQTDKKITNAPNMARRPLLTSFASFFARVCEEETKKS